MRAASPVKYKRQVEIGTGVLSLVVGVVYVSMAFHLLDNTESPEYLWWNPVVLIVAASILWSVTILGMVVQVMLEDNPGKPLLYAIFLLVGAVTGRFFIFTWTFVTPLVCTMTFLSIGLHYPVRKSVTLNCIGMVGAVVASSFSGVKVQLEQLMIPGFLIIGADIIGTMELGEWNHQSRLFDQARWAASQFVNVNIRMQDRIDYTVNIARFDERLRVAREVHDTVGYALTAALVQIRAVRKLLDTDPLDVRTRLEHLEDLVGTSLQEVRREVSNLRDDSFVSRSGAGRWIQLCEAFADSTGIRVTASIPESMEQVSEDLSESLYRIIQESLTNAYRHGKADHIDVAMTWKQNQHILLVRISDNGRGTSLVEPGNGLTGMQERIDHLGGKLVWQSRAGRGFDIGIEIPWRGGSVEQDTSADC